MTTSSLHTSEDLDQMLAALEAELSTLEIPGSAGVPPASDRRTPAPDSDPTTPHHHSSHPSHSPEAPTCDPTTPTPSSIHNSSFITHHSAPPGAAALAHRLAQIEPLLEVIELVEPRIKLLAQDRRQHTAREVISHVDEVTRLATRTAALRKTLLQIHHHPLHATAPIPPASSSQAAPSDCRTSDCRTGAPAGRDTSAPTPSSIHNSSFLIHNSPQCGAPTPAGLSAIASAKAGRDPSARTTPSANSIASVPTIRSIPSIPTIPLTKIQATAQKLYKDVLTLTRNTNPDPTPGTPTSINHGGVRPSQNAIDDTVATVTGVSGPKARHTTVTNAHPTPQRTTNPSHPIPHPHTTAPRTKVWKGRDGGLGEGRGNFSKLPLPSPSSSSSPTPANERPPP